MKPKLKPIRLRKMEEENEGRKKKAKPEETALATKKDYKNHLVLRSAYRAGQRDMLMKIQSILNTYCMGEEDRAMAEVKEYCRTYISETALDKQITDDNLKLLS